MTANDFLEAIKLLGLGVLPLTAYLALKKIGYDVAAFTSWRSSLMTAPAVSAVTLVNLKDRPVVIFSLHGVDDGQASELQRFEPPLVLRGLEAVRVDIEPVSAHFIDGSPLEVLPSVARKMTIYIESTSRLIKCRSIFPGCFLRFAEKKKFQPVYLLRRRFNGRVYSPRVKYAIVYENPMKEQQTAFVDDVGAIDWEMPPNRLRPPDLVSEESVRAALDLEAVEERIGPYTVTRLPHR